MKKFIVFIIILFAVSACTSPTPTITSMPTAAPTQAATTTLPPPTATATTVPTNTPAPTATPTLAPTPQGGGGKLVLTLFQSAYIGKFNLDGVSNVFVANPDGSDLKPLTNGPKDLENLAAAVSPDGSLIAYSQVKINLRYFFSDNALGDLFLIRPDGSGKVQLTTPQRKAFLQGVTWLPDGRLLFFGQDEKGNSIFLADPASGDITRLKSPNGTPGGLLAVIGLSPDGSGIYWAAGEYCQERGRFCNERYFWTKLDDSEHRRIWQSIQSAAKRIQISPDGKMMAYYGFFNSSANPATGCFIANIDGSGKKKLEGDYPNCFDIDTLKNPSWWSSDSSRIIYQDYDKTTKKGVLKIWSVADGKAAVLPDIQAGGCADMLWLPGDKQLLFFNCQSNRQGNPIPTNSRILDLDSGLVTLLDSPGFCDLRFSPDHRQALAYNCDQFNGPQPGSRFNVISLDDAPVTNGLSGLTVPLMVDEKFNQEFSYSLTLGQGFWVANP